MFGIADMNYVKRPDSNSGREHREHVGWSGNGGRGGLLQARYGPCTGHCKLLISLVSTLLISLVSKIA